MKEIHYFFIMNEIHYTIGGDLCLKKGGGLLPANKVLIGGFLNFDFEYLGKI